MELFAKQTVNDLKPFEGLWLFSDCKFSPLQSERYFRSNHQWCFKNLSSKFLKNTCEGVDFLLSFRLGIYSFTKNEIIHRHSSRILVASSAGSFTHSHFQVSSFVKNLLWHQNYFGVDYPFRSTHPHIMPYPTVNIKIFSTASPIIEYFEDHNPHL